LPDADTAENDPDTPHPVIFPVSCEIPASGAPKLSGRADLRIVEGTLLHRVLSGARAREEMFCNYEVNPAYAPRLQQAGLVFNAFGSDGQVRGVELSYHPFFLATLFQPQLSSSSANPHPIVIEYLRAALEAKAERV
jgi:CTP synthase (UTP-ammonia lyase)